MRVPFPQIFQKNEDGTYSPKIYLRAGNETLAPHERLHRLHRFMDNPMHVLEDNKDFEVEYDDDKESAKVTNLYV